MKTTKSQHHNVKKKHAEHPISSAFYLQSVLDILATRKQRPPAYIYKNRRKNMGGGSENHPTERNAFCLCCTSEFPDKENENNTKKTREEKLNTKKLKKTKIKLKT